MFKKLSLLVLCTVSIYAMHEAEININNKDLEIGAKFDLGQVNERIEPATTYIGINYINASDKYSDIDGEDANVSSFYEINFLMKREVKNSGVEIGIGIKANYTSLDENFITLPLGIEVGYTVPVAVPIKFGVELYYAPESLAVTDVHSYLETRAHVSVELIEKGYIMAGYRNINTNLKVDSEAYKINYNSSVYFGFKFDF